jgi:hypothetical protein
MGRAEKMDCGVNGEVIFTGATTEFQLKKGLTPSLFPLMNPPEDVLVKESYLSKKEIATRFKRYW